MVVLHLFEKRKKERFVLFSFSAILCFWETVSGGLYAKALHLLATVTLLWKPSRGLLEVVPHGCSRAFDRSGSQAGQVTQPQIQPIVAPSTSARSPCCQALKSGSQSLFFQGLEIYVEDQTWGWRMRCSKMTLKINMVPWDTGAGPSGRARHHQLRLRCYQQRDWAQTGSSLQSRWSGQPLVNQTSLST